MNIYRRARLRFAQRWTEDETVTGGDLLIVELYPALQARDRDDEAPDRRP